MAKANNKTTANKLSVAAFLNGVEDPEKRKAAKKINAFMKKITKTKPVMWGTSIVGFGTYHYKYESGREGDFMKVGFSPRKFNLTLYIMPGFGRYNALMKKLGKHKLGKSCLYIKKLEDIDMEILGELIRDSYEYMTNKYG